MGNARHREGRSAWWARPRALAVGMVLGAGLVAAVWLPGRHDVASAAERAVVFGDDFTGDRGTTASATKWLVADARGNANARLDGDGHLNLTSLMIGTTLFTQPYGHAEARVEVKRVSGPWRAFTVLGPSGRVMPGRMRVLDEDADPLSGGKFHTYAIDWTPAGVIWSVDGDPSIELTPDDPGVAKIVAFNLATDGTGPAHMVIDSVDVIAGPSAASLNPVTPSASAGKPAAPAWKAFTKYEAGQLVTYKGVVYKVKEAHTSLPGWEPTNLPALFDKV